MQKDERTTKILDPGLVIFDATKEELVYSLTNFPVHVALIQTKQKGSYPSHFHTGWEIIFVSEGILEVEVETKNYVLRAGDFLVIAGGKEHCIHKRTESFSSNLAMTLTDRFAYQDRMQIQNMQTFLMEPNNQESNYLGMLLTKFYEMETGDYRDEERRYFVFEEISRQIEILTSKKKQEVDIAPFVSEELRQLAEYITEHHEQPLTTELLANVAGYSRAHFCKYFKRETGMTIKQYLTEVRLNQVAMEMMHSNETISDVALKHGFPDDKGFILAFKRRYQMLPSKFRVIMKT